MAYSKRLNIFFFCMQMTSNFSFSVTVLETPFSALFTLVDTFYFIEHLKVMEAVCTANYTYY